MKANEHISDQNLSRYSQREADAAEILRIQTHLAACDVCRRKLAAVAGAERSFAALRENFALDEKADEPEHLTYEQLEFYLDRKLDVVTSEIVESHLAFCGECEKDLQDLIKFRVIAENAPAIINDSVVETAKISFWKRLFVPASIGGFAPVVAVVLIAILAGAWILMRGNRSDEIAMVNQNQNAAIANRNGANVNPADNLTNNNSLEISPSPQISPSANISEKERLYALSDGDLKVDERGNLQGAQNLSPATRELVRQSLKSGNVSFARDSLGGVGGVLMGENNPDGGVPFGLETPVGKVVRENQPLLRWKLFKNAENYSVAVVDDKFNVVATSGKINSTSWKPSKPLPRGANYSWQVTAILKDGTETVSPSAPAPQARFRVLEANLNDEIARLEKSANRSHLALGVLYAKAGMKQEARSEFEKLVKENPNSPLARKLLQSVR